MLNPNVTVMEQIKGELVSLKEAFDKKLADKVDPMADEMAVLTGQLGELAKRVGERAVAKGDGKVGAAVAEGMYEGMDTLDLAICKSFYDAAETEGNTKEAELATWKQNLLDALTSTGAGTGAELVGGDVAGQLWRDVRLAALVGGLFPDVRMPTDPWKLPRELGRPNWYPGTQNTATTDTDVASSNRQLDSGELVAEVDWSYDLDEDSVVAMVPMLREGFTMGAGEVMDDVIINAAQDNDATNINNDGTAIAANSAGLAQYRIGWDGLRAYCHFNANRLRNVNGAMTSAQFLNGRASMGKYGVRPGQLAFIVGPELYFKLLGLEEVQTLEKYGPQATILSGELGRIYNVPIIVSEFVKKAKADGKVDDTPGQNNRLQGLIVNRTQFVTGFRRTLLIEVFRHVQNRSIYMVGSFRMAFQNGTGVAGDNLAVLLHGIAE